MSDVSILRSPEVRERTGLGRTTIHNLVKSGRFPAPIALPGKRSGWLAHEIEDWILQRPRKASERVAACANTGGASFPKASTPGEPAQPARSPRQRVKPNRGAPSGTERNEAPMQQQLPL